MTPPQPIQYLTMQFNKSGTERNWKTFKATFKVGLDSVLSMFGKSEGWDSTEAKNKQMLPSTGVISKLHELANVIPNWFTGHSLLKPRWPVENKVHFCLLSNNLQLITLDKKSTVNTNKGEKRGSQHQRKQ